MMQRKPCLCLRHHAISKEPYLHYWLRFNCSALVGAILMCTTGTDLQINQRSSIYIISNRTSTLT
jgi:hypothetical protein